MGTDRREPLGEADDRYGDRCDHDTCRAEARYHCGCLCGRVLCETHEFEERRAFQVRQGLALIRHKPEAALIRARRERRRDEILDGVG